MKIFGVTLVRSQADIIALTIRYHLQLGLDRVLVLDNGSSDGTDEILARLAQADNRIQWRRHDGEYQQAELITDLAREAFRAGADWIVPFDADEFWHAPLRPFREALATTEAGALRAEVIHYIQRREHLQRTPEGLLTMTRRAPRVIGPPDRGRSLVESREIGYVEAMYAPKWICRASDTLEFGPGHHSAKNFEGRPETTLELVCLHAPIRSRDTLLQKAAHSLRLKAAGGTPDEGWHLHRISRLLEENLLEEEWAANSYADEGLDVSGVRRPVILDTTLRDAVAPLIASASGARGGEDSPPLSEAQWMIGQRVSVQNLLTNLHDEALARTAWAVDLNEQLVRARQHLAELETQVSDRTAWARSLDEELQRARTVISNLERLVAERTRWAQSQEDELGAAREQIVRLEARVAERTHWAQSQEGELGAAREQIVQLQAQVAERTRWAQTADAECARAWSALATLRSEFEERTAWALQLQQEVENAQANARSHLATAASRE